MRQISPTLPRSVVGILGSNEKRNFFKLDLALNLLFALMIGIGTLSVLMIFSLLAYQIYFLERVHLGVQFNEMDVSTLTQSELHDLVNRQAKEMLNRSVILTSADQDWTFTAASLGLQVDVEQTVHFAYSQGRRASFVADLFAQIDLMVQPIHIQPFITFDTGPVNNILNQLGTEINRSSTNAQLRLDEALEVVYVPAQIGRVIDLEASRIEIHQAILQGQPFLTEKHISIPLKIDYSHPSITEVDAAYQNLQSLLDASLVLRHDDQVWSLEPSFLAQLISIQTIPSDDGDGYISLSLDPEGLSQYFATIDQEIMQLPVNAWFHLDTETWTLIPIQESQPGYHLDIPAAVEMVTARLTGPGPNELTLPVVIEPAPVSSQYTQNLGIKELVSSATSYFKGSSAERMQNIQVAAAKFHGLVIGPGEIFSFNEYLGPVTAENGFVEGLIIVGDQTAVGIGGGVCQVSTTIFRAALYGGFEIVERRAHGYRVGWYETHSGPGLDATIYSPSVDIKFRNDTNSYILMQTEVDLAQGTITFNFYGTSPKRIVTVSEPTITKIINPGPPIYQEDVTLASGTQQQIEWAKDGMDVTIYRQVFEQGQIIHQDRIFSRYRPWRAKFKVGLQPVDIVEEAVSVEAEEPEDELMWDETFIETSITD